MDRRGFLERSAGVAGAAALGASLHADNLFAERATIAPAPAPISDDERRARIEKARRLMAEHKIDAMFLEGGTSLVYFTGVHCGNSERTQLHSSWFSDTWVWMNVSG